MSDLNLEGTAPQNVPTEDKDAARETRTTMKPLDPEVDEAQKMFRITPTVHVQGNEMIAIIRMLEAINKNMAFLATTVHRHLNPERK